MKVLSVVGARPNFVKMAPVISQLRRRLAPGDHVLVHTGQHYDRMLAEVFMEELDLGAPDHLLNVGSGSHAVQTARVMERLEPVLLAERPDLMLVPGDVNSTMAAALAAAKLHIPIAHLEAGLRSFDRTMPEEINRVVTDQLSEYLFVHSEEAIDNLLAEGIDESRIHFVGNTMIDSLVAVQEQFRNLHVSIRFGLASGDYVLVTLHRPALVEGPLLQPTVECLGELANHLPVLLPAHPRTRQRLDSLQVPQGVTVIDPVGYLEFLSLQADAAAVLTDSGGVQEETTYLGVPCFTLRSTTERPVTITTGTNTLLGLEPARILDILPALGGPQPARHAPPFGWDGHASERVAALICAESTARGDLALSAAP
jgi:UDP-N-acetylglucosamine 2-epimerase (non-hydrolysing)